MATLSSGSRGKSQRRDPKDHLGVFKSLEEVPTRYRFESFASEFKGRDVWSEYMDAEKGHLAESTRKYTYGRAERLWKSHMANVGRHHGLATPEDVETFFTDQLSEAKERTVYDSRFTPLFDFYDWLTNHAAYPHVYNPVLMAATDQGATHEMWVKRMEINTK